MFRRINLRNGLFCLINDSDFGIFKNQKFWAIRDGKTWYMKNRRGELLHRLILKPSKSKIIDHINGNGLDNRRCNLRICSIALNSQNRKEANFDSITGVRGVGKNKDGWVVCFRKDGKRYYFGRYNNQQDAINVAKIAIKSVLK